MDLTQKDINNLNAFVTRITKGSIGINSEDIVSSAILEALETGKGKNDLKSIIDKKLIAFRNDTSLTGLKKCFSKTETTRTCKACGQNLPIAMFHIFRYKKISKEIISSRCKPCHVEQGRKYRLNPEVRKKVADNERRRYHLKKPVSKNKRAKILIST